MKLNKLVTGVATTGLLLLLAGCGFKLDNKMLSADGGVWSVSQGHYYQFTQDGDVSIYEDGSKVSTGTYSVSDNKDDYELTLDLKGEHLGAVTSKMTIDVPKKDQKSNEFKGTAKISAGIKDNEIDAGSDSMTFTKEKEDVLENN